MAKNEYGNSEERKTNSYASPENDRQADIESEIDKILAEARQEKRAQKDFFSEEKLSEEKTEYLPKYGEEKQREPEVRKNHRESSRSTRETGHRGHSENKDKQRNRRETSNSTRDRKSHSTPKTKKQTKKSKGKGLIVAVAILAVLTAVAVGVYTYLSGNTTPPYEQGDKGNVETVTTTIPIHETLVVVTVSGEEISYNGEVLTSTDELESRLNSEESLTLSLINNDADAETYNAVATVLNKFGGSYELMNEQNTNPSIDTGTSSTEPSSATNTTSST
ncbi:MAG: hypothetical protein ACI4HL_03725 [Ruminococcus sp.]